VLTDDVDVLMASLPSALSGSGKLPELRRRPRGDIVSMRYLIVIPTFSEPLMVFRRREAKFGRDPDDPGSYLQLAEDAAINAVRTLRKLQTRKRRSAGKASVGDAVSLARTIAALAAFGRRQPAEQAIVIAGKVEILLDLLAREMDYLRTYNK
jgi:hypothetical protein